MNELQQEIFDEMVDHLVPIMDKYNDEDTAIVLQIILYTVIKTIKEAHD